MRADDWLEVKVVGAASLVSTPVGGLEVLLKVETRILWWRPSFWRHVRAAVAVRPSWLTWPVVAWLVLGFALRRRS